MQLSDPHSNKSFLPKNDSELSISEPAHSSALQNPRYNNTGLLSDSISHADASGRSRSGFGRLSSRGKTRRWYIYILKSKSPSLISIDYKSHI